MNTSLMQPQRREQVGDQQDQRPDGAAPEERVERLGPAATAQNSAMAAISADDQGGGRGGRPVSAGARQRRVR